MLLPSFLTGILILFASSVGATGAAGRRAERPKVPLRQYTAIEVEVSGDVTSGANAQMPEESITMIRREIVRQVIELHRFNRVMDFVDKRVAAAGGERVLLLKCNIVEASGGSSVSKGVLLGARVSKAKIVVVCTFVDSGTQEVIWEMKALGQTYRMGMPEALARVAAKEIVKGMTDNW
jgi:hypothetical protein